jgi:3-dehydroquinate synthase
MTAQVLEVSLGERSYPIHIGEGIARDPTLYRAHVAGRRAAVVTSETVARLHAPSIEAALETVAGSAMRIVIPDGEQHKDWRTLDLIYEGLLRAKADRRTVLVAVGGGVVGDMAGFAAATYQRGVSFLQVPTTLLAQVDSSVGGKTGINHPLGKNMIGAFHQPVAVIADTALLATLPERELSAGLAEVLKYGAISDAAFLGWIEQHAEGLRRRDPEALAHAIRRSCEIKAGIVAADERESGVRALLNFGHTFGHAIETGSGYGKWLHGEAVAAGMVMAARFSARQGRIPDAAADRLAGVVERLGLPIAPPKFEAAAWLDLMGRDKKNVDGRITLILLEELGRAAVVKDAPVRELESVLAAA